MKPRYWGIVLLDEEGNKVVYKVSADTKELAIVALKEQALEEGDTKLTKYFRSEGRIFEVAATQEPPLYPNDCQ